ncbi:MAG TPA: hypothetical protein VF189_01335 [Patescibacteria group bacterium]
MTEEPPKIINITKNSQKPLSPQASQLAELAKQLGLKPTDQALDTTPTNISSLDEFKERKEDK